MIKILISTVLFNFLTLAAQDLIVRGYGYGKNIAMGQRASVIVATRNSLFLVGARLVAEGAVIKLLPVSKNPPASLRQQSEIVKGVLHSTTLFFDETLYIKGKEIKSLIFTLKYPDKLKIKEMDSTKKYFKYMTAQYIKTLYEKLLEKKGQAVNLSFLQIDYFLGKRKAKFNIRYSLVK